MVSCLTFKFLRYIEFIIVYGMKKHFSFIDLHVTLQDFQTLFAEEIAFSSLYTLAYSVKD